MDHFVSFCYVFGYNGAYASWFRPEREGLLPISGHLNPEVTFQNIGKRANTWFLNKPLNLPKYGSYVLCFINPYFYVSGTVGSQVNMFANCHHARSMGWSLGIDTMVQALIPHLRMHKHRVRNFYKPNQKKSWPHVKRIVGRYWEVSFSNVDRYFFHTFQDELFAKTDFELRRYSHSPHVGQWMVACISYHEPSQKMVFRGRKIRGGSP